MLTSADGKLFAVATALASVILATSRRVHIRSSIRSDTVVPTAVRLAATTVVVVRTTLLSGLGSVTAPVTVAVLVIVLGPQGRSTTIVMVAESPTSRMPRLAVTTLPDA